MAMGAALRAGVSVLDFWEMTPHETKQAVAAYRDEMDWQMSLQWINASLQRASKMPPLETLLGTKNDQIQDEETSIAKLKTFLGVGAEPDDQSR